MEPTFWATTPERPDDADNNRDKYQQMELHHNR